MKKDNVLDVLYKHFADYQKISKSNDTSNPNDVGNMLACSYTGNEIRVICANSCKNAIKKLIAEISLIGEQTNETNG